jgi:hypothetical protein
LAPPKKLKFLGGGGKKGGPNFKKKSFFVKGKSFFPKFPFGKGEKKSPFPRGNFKKNFWPNSKWVPSPIPFLEVQIGCSTITIFVW